MHLVTWQRSLAVILITVPSLSVSQTIQRRGEDAVLVLPAPMQAALHAFDSTFAPRRLSDYERWHYYYPCRAPDDCPTPWYKITERQALFAAIGDFNGDKILDVVIDGEGDREGARVVIMSAGSGFRVEKLETLDLVPAAIRAFRTRPRAANEAEIGIKAGLGAMRPGTFRSSDETEPPLILTTDAFVLHYFEKGADLYYYRNGKWHVFGISD